MAFTQKLPEWNASGVEPSESQKQSGFQPGMKPPAQWFNWHLNWSYLALKELQEKVAEKSYVDAELDTIQADIQQLQEDVQNADIPDASLTEKGKTQLSSATDSTLEDRAATPKAVKTAYDRGSAGLSAASTAQSRADSAYTEATAAKQLGVEQKNNVVAALNSIGVAASTSDSWTQLINKISSVIRATGNATVAQVLAGATFSNASGNGRTGTMPNRSAQSAHQQALSTEVWQADRTFFRPPDGYYDGNSWVYALTPNLRPENLKEGLPVLGVIGTAKVGEAPYKMPQITVPAGASIDVPLPYDFNFLFIQSGYAPTDWVYITRVNIADRTNQQGYTSGGTPINTSFPTATTLRFNNSGNGVRWYDVTIIKRLY